MFPCIAASVAGTSACVRAPLNNMPHVSSWPRSQRGLPRLVLTVIAGWAFALHKQQHAILHDNNRGFDGASCGRMGRRRRVLSWV